MGRQIHVRASVGMRKGKLDTCLRGYGQASATHPTHSCSERPARTRHPCETEFFFCFKKVEGG